MVGYWLLKLRRKCDLLEKTIEAFSEMQERKIAKAALEARAQERKRFAKDWHDGMGNTLATLRLLIESEASGDEKQQEIIQLLEGAQKDFRQIADNEQIMSFSGKTEILEAFRKWQSQLKLGNINLVYKVYDFLNYRNSEAHLKNQLYRITQELISNAIKHAKASKIELELLEASGNIELKVVDDGIGMKAQADITSVQERVDSLNGQVFIEANQPEGTAVKVLIPLKLV